MPLLPRASVRDGLALFLLWSSPATADLTLNEVLYDPSGPDGDREFVELYNDDSSPRSLEGVELVFVNGAEPDRPRVLWTGGAEHRVPARGWFVVGGAGVPSADVTLSLSLQNGPDALWLRRGAEVLDRLAWGEVDGLGEGSAAPDVSGESLGRTPDGRDTQDNARDFRGLDPPSPGAENLPAVRWDAGPLRLDPPWLPRPGVLVVEVELRAEGWAPTQSGRFWLEGSPQPPVELQLTAGESRILRWPVPVDTATDSVVLRLDSSPRPRTWGRGVQVGPGSIVLNEVMARPLPGRPEWIEIHNRGTEPVDLAAWALADSDGELRVLGPSPRLEPGAFLLLSSNPGEMDLPSAHRPQGGWPPLNQSDSDDGYADALSLFDPEGRAVDHLRWTQAQLETPGRSLERARVSPHTPAVWIPAPGGATPGRPNDSARHPLPASGLQARPNPFSPDGDGAEDFLHVALQEPAHAATAEAEVFDLAGDSVRRLSPAGGGPVRQWIWDGRDEAGRVVPAGAYVLVLRSSPAESPARAWRRLIAVGRR